MSAELASELHKGFAERPLVADLLKEHADAIGALRAALEGVEGAAPFAGDDLWLLRFVLSYPKADEAAKSAREAIAWRRAHEQVLRLAQERKPHPQQAMLGGYMKTALFELRDGTPLFVIRAGHSNPKQLVSNVSRDTILEFLMFTKEEALVRCDEATRRTGRLVKMLVINDLDGTSLRTSSRKFAKILGDSSKLAEVVYPQLMERTVIVNPPTVFKIMFKFAKVFMSKRTLAKLSVCPGKTKEGDIESCPFVKRRLHVSDVPHFLGGQRTVDESVFGSGEHVALQNPVEPVVDAAETSKSAEPTAKVESEESKE